MKHATQVNVIMNILHYVTLVFLGRIKLVILNSTQLTIKNHPEKNDNFFTISQSAHLAHLFDPCYLPFFSNWQNSPDSTATPSTSPNITFQSLQLPSMYCALVWETGILELIKNLVKYWCLEFMNHHPVKSATLAPSPLDRIYRKITFFFGFC